MAGMICLSKQTQSMAGMMCVKTITVYGWYDVFVKTNIDYG